MPLPASFVIVGGFGPLPELVYRALAKQDIKPRILSLPGSNHAYLDPHCRFVGLQNFLTELNICKAEGATDIVLAGGVNRQAVHVDAAVPAQGDINLAAGDDRVLRNFIQLIEGLGYKVWGLNEIVPDIIDHAGVLTTALPDEVDERDAERAEDIVAALGRVDVGQAAVIRHQVCWGIETSFGTDWMLESLKGFFNVAGPEAKPGGLLYKATKPHQDLRVDLPTIGLRTIKLVAELGLAGIVVESMRTIILDKPKVINQANSEGLFIWSKVKSP